METVSDNAWFYIRDHQQQGPVGMFELEKMFEHGILTGDTYIWKKDMACWQMAKSLDLFPDLMFTTEQDENLAANWTELQKDTYPNGRPIVRCLARLFDLTLCSLFLITFVSIFFPKFIVDLSGFTIFFLSLLLWLALEPFILTTFGTTGGKALLNAKIRTVNGDPITFSTAFQRSIFVSAAGMGFGVPFILFICNIFSFLDLKRHGKSTWDKQIGTVVLYGKVSIIRLFIASLFPIGMLIGGIVIH